MTSIWALLVVFGLFQSSLAAPATIIRTLFPAGTFANAQDSPTLVGQILQPQAVQPAVSQQQLQPVSVQLAPSVQQSATVQPAAVQQQQANPVQQLLAGSGLTSPTPGTIAVVLQNSGSPAALNPPQAVPLSTPAPLVGSNSLPAGSVQAASATGGQQQQQPVIISVANPNFVPQQQPLQAVQQPQQVETVATVAPVAVQQVPSAANTQADSNASKPARDAAGGRPAADFSCYLLQQQQKQKKL